MTNIENILKSRDITFPNKIHLVKATVFFLQSCTDVVGGSERKLSVIELMLSNCGVGEDS